VALDANEGPSVTDGNIIFALTNLGLFLHSNVSPKFIALNVFHSQSVDAFVHQLLALLTRETQQVQDRAGVYSGYSGSGADAATLNQVLQNAYSLLFGQDHISERFRLGFNEGLFADCAAISLLTTSVFPELFSYLIAGWAVHSYLSLTTQEYQTAQALSREIVQMETKNAKYFTQPY
jgi:hypothetical protein